MATWNEFLSSAKKAFNKAAVKVNDIADTASDSIKIETLKIKLCEKYEQLGRIVYDEMKSEADEANAQPAADKAAEIDALNAQIAALKARIEKRKSEKCDAKAESSDAKEESKEEPKEPLALPESESAEKDETDK